NITKVHFSCHGGVSCLPVVSPLLHPAIRATSGGPFRLDGEWKRERLLGAPVKRGEEVSSGKGGGGGEAPGEAVGSIYAVEDFSRVVEQVGRV
ncbi:hypothetical protein Droror1_Dr00013059, partial [Drosera rotundifolia]